MALPKPPLADDRGIEVVPSPPKVGRSSSTWVAGTGSVIGLAVFNIILFFAHMAISAIVATYDIRFPVTVFETRLSSEVITNFTCIYNYGFESNGERWCETESAVPTQNFSDPGVCTDTINWYNDTGNIPAMEGGGPLLSAYRLTRMGDNTTGASATRWILFSISAVTALFHLMYAVGFIRMTYRPVVLSFFLTAGGIPARWYEYAITASLMSFFISNLANVFEFYALLGFGLGTFALMYFGLVIERELYSGRVGTALKMLYVPSMALFVLTWLPNVRQVALDVFAISCADPNATFFGGCTTKTCFGEEIPIAVFVLVLLALFIVFPLITIQKVYSVGGFASRWTSTPVRYLRRGFCVESAPPMVVLYTPVVSLLHVIFFFGFALVVGPSLAVLRIISDILYPVFLTPIFLETTVTIPDDVKKSGFIVGEWLYALASATSKIFLAVYFLFAFAQRNW